MPRFTCTRRSVPCAVSGTRSISATIRAAKGNSRSPSGVRLVWRVLRSKRVLPSSVSSSRIRWDNGGTEM